MRQMTLTQSGVPELHLEYMDFVEIFNISLDLSSSYFVHILVGVELPLCIVVTLL